jgi:hypothetical protein
VFIISLLLLSSCINENTLHSSFPIQLLHGNSAKVWVLAKSSDPNDKNVAAMNNYRKSFIFYSNKRFRDQELIHLGSKEGFKGKYTVNNYPNNDTVLNLNYSDGSVYYFRINTIGNQTMTLQDINHEEIIWEFTSLKPPKI